MDPIPGEKIFREKIQEFNNNDSINNDDISEIKQFILNNRECLLVLDKPVLSRLEAKLIKSGTLKDDPVIDKIEQIVSTWNNDVTDLLNEVSNELKIFQKLSSLKKGDKLIINRNRLSGEYVFSIEKEGNSIISSISTFALAASRFGTYQRFDSLTDVMKILQSMHTSFTEHMGQLVLELSDKNISHQDFEKGLLLLTSILTILPVVIDKLDYLKSSTFDSFVEEEQNLLIEFNQFLTTPLLNELIHLYEEKHPIQGNIVCEYSQGRLTEVRNSINIVNEDDDNQGSLACAVICLKAVQSFFDKGLPKNEKEIYTLIDKGVTDYKLEKFEGLVLFEDALNNLDQKEKNKLESVMLTVADGIDEPAAMAFDVMGEFAGSVEFYLDTLLTSLKKKIDESDNRTCAVLTTQTPRATNATLVIMFDEEKRPVLFNSHGEAYKGELKGASLLKFSTMDELNAYVKKTFFKNEEGQFQIKILQSVLNLQSRDIRDLKDEQM
ncbi:MAG: hypothetical protein H0T62_05055 [Parachlamydiaceae bacterium]|nr:hypothetical protein [Parachlamydiaceae bacterium]